MVSCCWLGVGEKGEFLQADFPAPEGPIIKIFNVGNDSSDAMAIKFSKTLLRVGRL